MRSPYGFQSDCGKDEPVLTPRQGGGHRCTKEGWIFEMTAFPIRGLKTDNHIAACTSQLSGYRHLSRPVKYRLISSHPPSQSVGAFRRHFIVGPPLCLGQPDRIINSSLVRPAKDRRCTLSVARGGPTFTENPPPGCAKTTRQNSHDTDPTIYVLTRRRLVGLLVATPAARPTDRRRNS